MNRSAFIFDLDGVIVDTAKYHFIAWKNLADRLGIPFDHEVNEGFKGVSRQRSLELLLERGNLPFTPQEFDRWMIEKNEDYLELISEMTDEEILPGVLKVLQYLKDRGQGIALGSASKNAQLILDRVGISDFFDCVIDGNKVSKAKPDPEVFLKAAEGLGVAPDRSIVFEDAIAGITAANTAGMYSVGIGEKSTLSHAQVVFTSFNDITIQFLDKLIQ